MAVYSIGFTQTSAERFFGALSAAGVRRLVDVRLHNVSQLAGFAKRDDLAYFLRSICDAEYRHEPLLAPTQALLDEYRKEKRGWPTGAGATGGNICTPHDCSIWRNTTWPTSCSCRRKSRRRHFSPRGFRRANCTTWGVAWICSATGRRSGRRKSSVRFSWAH